MADEKILKTTIQVRRDTTANWLANKDVIPAEGEPCLDLDTGLVKYGNGVDTYENLEVSGGKTATHYEGVKATGELDNDTMTRVLKEANAEAKVDDIFVVKSLIAEGKYSYTSYVYDGSNWVAMDGNYNASNVYFDADLMTTTAIGNITLTNGQATIPAKGGNLIDLFNTIYVEEDDESLKKSSPSAKLSSTSPTYYEIGKTGTRNITVSMNDDGEYKYGYLPLASETGSETAGDAATTITTGTGTGVVVTATKPFELTFNGADVEPTVENGGTFTLAPTAQTAMAEMKMKGRMNYDKGGIPVSNLKKLYPAQRIAAGYDDTDEAVAFRWYIPFYQGFTYSDTAIADHANITAEQLTTSLAAPAKQTADGKVVSTSQNVKNVDSVAYSKTKCTKAAAAKAWRQYYLAYPKDWSYDMSGAKDSNGIDCTVNQANDVELDINGTKVTYAVYYINNAADYGTLGITWTLN